MNTAGRRVHGADGRQGTDEKHPDEDDDERSHGASKQKAMETVRQDAGPAAEPARLSRAASAHIEAVLRARWPRARFGLRHAEEERMACRELNILAQMNGATIATEL